MVAPGDGPATAPSAAGRSGDVLHTVFATRRHVATPRTAGKEVGSSECGAVQGEGEGGSSGQAVARGVATACEVSGKCMQSSV